MAKQKKNVVVDVDDGIDDLTSSLISDINKEFGQRVAYNLAHDEAPTVVKRWISTGSKLLDYAIANRSGGGYPEGRIIEITGLPSSGKSHLAYHAAAVTQRLGGLVVYVDTENATPIEKLKHVGINVQKGFVYVDTHCTEEVFSVIEATVLKAKALLQKKDVPILVIWDSVAATSPKAELEGEYEDNTMGLQARVISKGMRKITGVIGQNNVTLLCLNQLREKMGGPPHADNLISPGGKGIPFHASIRIRLGSGAPVKDKDGNVIGIHVNATLKKNKVAPPFRKCEFDILFGKGIVEDEFLFDELRSWSDDKGGAIIGDKKIQLTGSGAWKTLMVTDITTGEVLVEKKFYKAEFGSLMKDEQYKPFIDLLAEKALIFDLEASTASDEPQDDGDEDVSDD